MDYMFQPGFLGTKAPFFMDFVTLVVALLPLLVGIAILFARKGYYNLHGKVQGLIFIISVIVVGYFEYGVRFGGGYKVFIQNTQVSYDYLFVILVVHITIAILTLGIWYLTLQRAYKEYRHRYRTSTLPGIGSEAHKKAGKYTFLGIVATSLTGIWVYLLLFVC
ncbi:MAG: DUF420 domain-containing protein [Sulfurovum sp.]|nr:DUF420 domain-containing protein [Sulfurovum sp.]MCB4765916.1 DUF420 domain-containing protein [Sulfurovum sp.]